MFVFVSKYRYEMLVVGLAIFISGAIYYQYTQQLKTVLPIKQETKNLTRKIDPTDDLIYGNPNADLFVVEYGDLQCVHCKNMQPILKNIVRTKYGTSGKVAWVWRHGFHVDDLSIDKAITLDCVRYTTKDIAGGIAAWQFIDKSLEGGVHEPAYPPARYQKIFKEVGISEADVNTCRKNAQDLPIIKRIENGYLDIQNFNITETPYIQFITKSGDLIYESRGEMPEAEIKRAVDLYFTNPLGEKR